MFRSLCFTLLVLQAAFGANVNEEKVEDIVFTEQDIVPKGQTKVAAGWERASSFIGDLTLGVRHPDETVFTRVYETYNSANVVQGFNLNLNVQYGKIHYISVVNQQGSFAAVCPGFNTMGSSVANMHVRAPPNSKVLLTVVVAVH